MLTPHTHAALLSTGDEVVLGQILDRNAPWLAQRLLELGVMPAQMAAVPDDLLVLSEAIARLARSAPLLVMTGGLGPTEGDLTRQALCRVLGCGMVTDEAALADLRALFGRRGRPLTDRQARQAQRPEPARCLPNAVGTAPGLHVVIPVDAPHRSCDVLCLPGPPGELRPMWDAHAVGLLRPRPGVTVRTRMLHVVGLPEADTVTRLGELTRRDRSAGGEKPLVGITASGGVLTLRLRYEGPGDAARAEALLDADESTIRTTLGVHVVARSPATLASAVIDELERRRQTLAVVESCTGGGLGALISDAPGSSRAFVGGWITYSNEAKARDVGVPMEELARRGAVSPEVAHAMAVGGRERSGADYALALTGIAGPSGGSDDKPVGTVWIALARRGWPQPDVRRFQIPGDREDVRSRAARTALAMLWFAIKADHPAPALLWQSR